MTEQRDMGKENGGFAADCRISMLGIDYESASLEIREKFSFLHAASEEAMRKIREETGSDGLILLSTCNRTELYWYGEKSGLYPNLCKIKGLDAEKYRKYFTFRKGEAAVRHLFMLSCGMKSLITGEDQILSQVRDARMLARECGASHPVLETLFQKAVTVGKEVRTEFTFAHGNHSAAETAIAFLKGNGYRIKGEKCLVIGNGEMGKLTADILVGEGASVTVTVRQYHSGMVCIPEGCERINYSQRYEMLGSFRYIFSATSSPNLTITKEEAEKSGLRAGQVFVDLAVPRDIDRAVADCRGAVLFDIDDLNIERQSEDTKKQLQQASERVETAVREFCNWESCRDLLDRIRDVSGAVGEQVDWRARGVYHNLPLEQENTRLLSEGISEAAEKETARMIFLLKDHMGTDTLRQCLDIWQKDVNERK